VKDRILCTLLASALVIPCSALAQEPAPTPAAAGRTPPASANTPTPAPTEPSKPGETTKSSEAGKAPEGAGAAPVTKAPTAASRDARIRELETKVERMMRAMAEAKPSPASPAPPAAANANANANANAPSAAEPAKDLDPLRGIVLSAYVQAQLENHEDSEDQVRPGGAPLNQNRFLIRRGRFRIAREWDYSSLMMEIDGNTTRGPAIQLFKAEASVMWRGGQPKPAPPLIKFTIGLFDVPFGYEVLESPRTRYFMERSLQSRAFFPTEPDLGLRVSGDIAWFRYSFAITNGQPLGTPDGFAGQDPNNHKDFIGRVVATAKPTPETEVWGGISFLNGLGFVKGTDATKNILVWTDTNEDRRVTTDEIFGQPATAASPSYNFERWAVGADLGVTLKTQLGYSKLYGELQLGSNMDRALFIANPTIGGQPSRELGYYIGFLQEITPYGMVGFRFDHYDPNADFLGYQSGKQVPLSQVVNTASPLVAMAIPGRARLVFQYDYVSDSLGRTADGLPTDLKNDQWTLRLQGEL
jgi:hypothetical protein